MIKLMGDLLFPFWLTSSSMPSHCNTLTMRHAQTLLQAQQKAAAAGMSVS